MTFVAGEGAPVEVHLSDGGHVIVAFADAFARTTACDPIVDVLVRTTGSERDVERAVVDEVEAVGLRCTCSPSHRPTVIVVDRR